MAAVLVAPAVVECGTSEDADVAVDTGDTGEAPVFDEYDDEGEVELREVPVPYRSALSDCINELGVIKPLRSAEPEDTCAAEEYTGIGRVSSGLALVAPVACVFDGVEGMLRELMLMPVLVLLVTAPLNRSSIAVMFSRATAAREGADAAEVKIAAEVPVGVTNAPVACCAEVDAGVAVDVAPSAAGVGFDGAAPLLAALLAGLVVVAVGVPVVGAVAEAVVAAVLDGRPEGIPSILS